MYAIHPEFPPLPWFPSLKVAGKLTPRPKRVNAGSLSRIDTNETSALAHASG